ncbi:ThiF family adenylyltransferase [methane-oxidizing endosymbiont of Gigantopelta aegis]|uniref:ThiF family adenylyltransferase n=1 Tax=methane-oxidizing endosymbiont of Gigantopelta aegis TaxID=2794938 RepID=UPI001FD8FD8D|nr:ThiF family adenylyltransferase [methane-oxidizing endosymbiont of Gigantopelta aegis]
MKQFSYDEAFSRNIGWVTENELELLRSKKVAVGGLGGVGGSHLIVLARLGIGHFHISDLDTFEIANFNRQYGACMTTLNRPKAEVMEETLKDINPDVKVTNFPNGITLDNLDEFLRDVDIYVDSLDIFALPIRRAVFMRCYELGIPAVTAAPMGMGTSMLVFMPGKMDFESYFDLDGYSFEEQILRFVIGVSPSVMQRAYLVDRSAVNFLKKKVPSTPMGIELAAGVACTNILKILLNRGGVIYAPWGCSLMPI